MDKGASAIDSTDQPPVPDQLARCGAKNRSGRPCRRFPTEGSKRCHYHGGAVARMPVGCKQRGGGPITHGLYVRHLDAEQQAIFHAASVDAIDDEIRLAKTILDTVVKRWAFDPTGGVIQSRGDSVIRERLHVDIVREQAETVGRLLKIRARLKGEGGMAETRSALEELMGRIKSGEPPAVAG